MTRLDAALGRLRGVQRGAASTRLGGALDAAGVGFVADGGPLEGRWHDALVELDSCIGPLETGGPDVLSEGGPYSGSWIESTGTISAEILSRFAPAVAQQTFEQFAAGQRDDGLIPYKVTADGAGFSQIQIVTPLARSVWNHYVTTGRDRGFLERMYAAMARNDAWLAENRDTLGTGGVEAFCTFDTGHDLSPRFWFAPDRCLHGEAAHVDPRSTAVPVVAPDLTANVACQRRYLATIAHELGDDSAGWTELSRRSYEALWRECWNEADATFYDRDRDGNHVKVISDVLLRAWACEVGDADDFARSLRTHLMDTRAFLAHYGFTSVSMSDPRFDHDFRRNSWGGPVNFLTQVRAPHAFERHGRHAELGLVSTRLLSALARADRFPQCLDPWSGDAGYTQSYSPAILWFMDAIERWCGVMARPGGDVWFTGAIPTRLDHGASASVTAYSRTVHGERFELVGDDSGVIVYRDEIEWASFPAGLRLVWSPALDALAVVNVSPARIVGGVRVGGNRQPVSLEPNAHATLTGGRVVAPIAADFVAPRR
jgi:hypothetical protein